MDAVWETYSEVIGKPGADLATRVGDCHDNFNLSYTSWEGYSRLQKSILWTAETVQKISACAQIAKVASDAIDAATFYKDPATLAKITAHLFVHRSSSLSKDEGEELIKALDMLIDGLDLAHNLKDINKGVKLSLSKKFKVPLRSSTYRKFKELPGGVSGLMDFLTEYLDVTMSLQEKYR